ncbi:MAG: hypothetical protein HY875_14550 [Chloroflexi bacterium]|nr:hypothetical protein [Chloroflexota bacterium]
MTLTPAGDVLSRVAAIMEAAGIPWMLVGSTAALFYGRNRSTLDIDIVVDCARLNPEDLVAACEPDFFLDLEMVRDSMKSGIMFNAIPRAGGMKIDLIPLSNDEYRRAAFARRTAVDWHGATVYVATAEDVVLGKLLWARESESERQLADVRAIMALGEVDEHDPYFHHWVRRLRLEATLDAGRSTRYEA